jgi:hypothetical protein
MLEFPFKNVLQKLVLGKISPVSSVFGENVLHEIAPRVKMFLTIWSLVYEMSVVKMFEYMLECPFKKVLYEITSIFRLRKKMCQHFVFEEVSYRVNVLGKSSLV